MSDTPLVLLEAVVRRREQGDMVFLLRIPWLAVRPGEFVALVGDSGSGKSTLLDMLALVLRPSTAHRFEMRLGSGAIGAGPVSDIAALWQRGQEAALAGLRRQHLGYVLQTGGLLPFLSVWGNLTLPLAALGRRPNRPEISRAAERLGLDRYLDLMPDRLSGGERQRVAVLRALLHRPALVLADEPTAAVDKSRARAIVADLHALARDVGSAIVMVTHDLDLVREVADSTYRCSLEDTSAERVEVICAPV
jgi:putative ABC transport system ATP-binding protein